LECGNQVWRSANEFEERQRPRTRLPSAITHYTGDQVRPVHTRLSEVAFADRRKNGSRTPKSPRSVELRSRLRKTAEFIRAAAPTKSSVLRFFGYHPIRNGESKPGPLVAGTRHALGSVR
jgi:hypothetical protein